MHLCLLLPHVPPFKGAFSSDAPLHRVGAGMTDRLLTARAVAELLDVSSETVLRWARRGELPAIKLPGGAIRFREDELEAWLSERATTVRGVVTHPAGRRPAGKLATVTHPKREED
jgi:excisionase family DNA binding protein